MTKRCHNSNFNRLPLCIMLNFSILTSQQLLCGSKFHESYLVKSVPALSWLESVSTSVFIFQCPRIIYKLSN